MANQAQIDRLNNYFDVVNRKISEENLKFYHLKTIKNFITHFDKLRPSDTEEAFESLVTYFEAVDQIGAFEAKETTKEIYQQLVYPIALDYYIKIGFVVYARWQVIYGLFGILLLIVYLLALPSFIYLIVSILFIIHHCWVLGKKVKNKVFGYRY